MKTHTLCPVTFFRKSCRLWDKVEKCGGAREATWQDSTAHSRCMQTQREICNTYCLFTAAMISWTRLSVTLCLYCLSCLNVSFKMLSTCFDPVSGRVLSVLFTDTKNVTTVEWFIWKFNLYNFVLFFFFFVTNIKTLVISCSIKRKQ